MLHPARVPGVEEPIPMVLWWRKKKEDESLEAEKPAAQAVPPATAPAQELPSPKPAPEVAKPGQKSWLSRLTDGIARTRSSFTDQIKSLFTSSPRIDEEFYERLEEILIGADCGVEIAAEVMALLRQKSGEDPAFTPDKGIALLKEFMRGKLTRHQAPLNLNREPFSVILIVGVNGVGKTTTIAKLAHVFQGYGKKMMLVAGDTFRAGAIEQLCVWGQRLGIDVSKGAAGADPSAVVFDALCAARARKVELVIIDTAGRLHTQTNLMEEIRKVRRVIQKVVPDGPHETFLVLDSTTGQNAISQARLFDEALSLSGLVLTKLDGTAKGGIVIACSQKLGIPIRFVGVGESLEDLDAFKPDEFVDALFQ
jgi:fused signal recognition particle receptor